MRNIVIITHYAIIINCKAVNGRNIETLIGTIKIGNAVSYTHLDVYKRQVNDVDLLLCFNRQTIESSFIHGSVYSLPADCCFVFEISADTIHIRYHSYYAAAFEIVS